MRLDRRLGDTHASGHVRNPADLDDRQQDAKFGWRQLEEFPDEVWRHDRIERGLADKQDGAGLVAGGERLPAPGRQRHEMADIMGTVVSGQMQRDTRAHCRTFAEGGIRQRLPKHTVGTQVGRNKPAPDRAKHVGLVQDVPRARIGVRDEAVGVEQQDAGSQRVERARRDLVQCVLPLQPLDDLSARTAFAPAREQIEGMSSLTDSLFAQADEARLNPKSPDRQFGTFFRGGGEFGHRAASINQAASRISRPFGAAGVEYRFDANSRGGLALGYADGRDRFAETGSQTNTKTTTVHAFLSTQLGDTGIALDGSAGYGWSQIDSTRNLPSLARTAQAAYDGNVWSAALKASKSFKLAGEATLVPYALVDTEEARQDAYQETGANAANLAIPKLTSRNSAVEGGATLLLPFPIQSGALTARVQAGWRYLFEDGSGTFATRLAGSPLAFDTRLDGPGRNSAHVEASVTAALGKGTLATLGYRGELGATGQTLNAVEGRVVFRF